MTELLIIIAVVIAVAIPFGILNDRHKKTKERATEDEVKRKNLDELRKELWQKIDVYNMRVVEWQEFHKKYEHLGEPTTSVGYSILKSYEPWTQPIVNLKIDESNQDINTQLEWTMKCLAIYPVKYHLPEVHRTATFWKDAKKAYIGGFMFTPEQLRYIKSRTDKTLNAIIVTITTTNIECPMHTIEFNYDDREIVDELKAAFNAFKVLK